MLGYARGKRTLRYMPRRRALQRAAGALGAWVEDPGTKVVALGWRLQKPWAGVKSLASGISNPEGPET